MSKFLLYFHVVGPELVLVSSYFDPDIQYQDDQLDTTLQIYQIGLKMKHTLGSQALLQYF